MENKYELHSHVGFCNDSFYDSISVHSFVIVYFFVVVQICLLTLKKKVSINIFICQRMHQK